jgi:hypothetical protein
VPLFAVIRERFGEWDFSRDLREQVDWDEHAAFMDAMAEEGFLVLAGPLEDERRVLLVFEAPDEAAIHDRLAGDVWTGRLLRTVSVDRWGVLIGRERLG